jgi:aryl-alcohol dehydrogenase-like predicted oxidoreductase
MGQVSLAWINTKVTSPIVGFSSAQRMEEAIIPGYKLTDEEIKFLEEPYRPQNIRGHQ